MERAVSKEQVEQLRALFVEYARDLDFPLCFQGFDKERENLPAGYEVLLLEPGKGCVGLRRLDPATAELKRLYVRPAARREGLGRRLAQAVIGEARERGFSRVVLDTFAGRMDPAIALYRSLGFREIPPYFESPLDGRLYMELKLR